MSRVVGLDRSTRSACRRELNWIDQPGGLGDALAGCTASTWSPRFRTPPLSPTLPRQGWTATCPRSRDTPRTWDRADRRASPSHVQCCVLHAEHVNSAGSSPCMWCTSRWDGPLLQAPLGWPVRAAASPRRPPGSRPVAQSRRRRCARGGAGRSGSGTACDIRGAGGDARVVVLGVEVFSQRVFGLEQLWAVLARKLVLGRVRLGVLAHRRPVPKRFAAVGARHWRSHRGVRAENVLCKWARSGKTRPLFTIGLT